MKANTPDMKRRASVLVLVLIVVSSMTILAVDLAYRSKIEIRLAGANAERTQAYYLALGGIERAKALINEDELSSGRIGLIDKFSRTAKEEKLFEQLESHRQEDIILEYLVKDEQGYLNINKSDPACWERIKSVSSEQAASIVDWMDADNQINPEGAETDFYKSQEPGYICKNSSYTALKELTFVKSIACENYLPKELPAYSYQEQMKGKNLRTLLEAGEKATDSGFVNIFTVFGNGRININTASRAILSVLPGVGEQGTEYILSYRSGPDGQPETDDDSSIEDADGISDIDGLTELQVELLGQYCCYESEYFRVFSYASSGKSRCLLMATVKVAGGKTEVISVERFL